VVTLLDLPYTGVASVVADADVEDDVVKTAVESDVVVGRIVLPGDAEEMNEGLAIGVFVLMLTDGTDEKRVFVTVKPTAVTTVDCTAVDGATEPSKVSTLCIGATASA